MQPAAGVTDAELVARCRAGDGEAWNLLVERFSRFVFAICVRGFRLSESDAEDVFQDVFAKTFEQINALRDDGAIRPWIAQLTRRACIDRLRASRETPQHRIAVQNIPQPHRAVIVTGRKTFLALLLCYFASGAPFISAPVVGSAHVFGLK